MRRPTRRQREFAAVYVVTGNAARAAREAGYKGRYAAQAGYKMLARPGTVERILYWRRFNRLMWRAVLLRAFSRLRGALERQDAPLDVQRKAGEHIAAAAALLGLVGDPACARLRRMLRQKPPNWRRLYLRPWEDGEASSGTAA